MIVWDEALVQAIGRRRSVIVIGSGVSRNSINKEGKRPPTWEEFLKSASTKLDKPEIVERLIAQKDYLTACEIIKRKLSQDRFVTLVQDEYQRPGYVPAEIHKHIYNLDASIVASPNFDNIFDTYAATTSAGSIIIKDQTSLDILPYLTGGNTRLLIKTHGSANNPEDIIFTRTDYARARTKHVLFYEILKSLVLTHTFLFIGCGIDDPDIRSLFEDVQFAHGRMPYHFMTIPDNEVDGDVLEVVSDSMKIKFFKYSPDNRHNVLTASLKELVDRVDEYRLSKTRDQKW